jgi:multidrug efflux pump subunit AcrA (membrane-fusion protein)
VPEQSVVLRPAGKVVYVIAEVEGKAQQQVVKAGAKRGGMVEILKGLKGGETVALDGAGFLTNNARWRSKRPSPARADRPRRRQSKVEVSAARWR